MKRHLAVAVLCVLPTPCIADVRDAIVKIYTVSQGADYYNPWSMHAVSSSTGSGAILSGNRILTNAHVVSDQRMIEVRRNGDPQRHEAHLLAVAHEADLALLKVDDPGFFSGVTPLELGSLPELQQEVLVYGFPWGGDVLSITKGVVSRVEHQVYVHSARSFLAGQIDAAINPGNSGGPVIVGDKIVGVAMQSIPGAQSIGYMVPSPMVTHFLDDLADGHYDGFPRLGVRYQEMQNPDERRKYAFPEGRSGILVIGVVPGTAAAPVIKTGDVLLSVASHPIANDGTVEFRPRERTRWMYYLDQAQLGSDVAFEILRDGNVRSATLKLSAPTGPTEIVSGEQYDRLPTYFIYGGLVFSPLTTNYLQAWGNDWRRSAPPQLTSLLGLPISAERDEVVILVKVLAASVNEGYHDIGSSVVTEVDGQKVKNLKALVAAVEGGKSTFVTFTHGLGEQIVLDRSRVRSAQDTILKTYRIPADRSEDLKPR